MLNTNVFHYINVLGKAADASWLRNEAIGNNIANATTPNYKRQDVSFEAELEKALGHVWGEDLDSKISKLNQNLNRINGKPYIDSANYSYRLDGNNVDPETENVMLVENQLKYQGLMDCITQEFQNLKTVMQ